MVYTGRAIKHNNHLRIDDPAFQIYKDSIGEGRSVPVIFGEERRIDKHMHVFEMYKDRYADFEKIEPQIARDLIKYKYGVRVHIQSLEDLRLSTCKRTGRPYEVSPQYSESGTIELVYLVSTNAMTKSEVHFMINRLIDEMDEKDIPHEDIDKKIKRDEAGGIIENLEAN
jgi:hypothetical protein